jgi:hypothetical protein
MYKKIWEVNKWTFNETHEKKLGKSENDKKYCKKKNFVNVDSVLPYLATQLLLNGRNNFYYQQLLEFKKKHKDLVLLFANKSRTIYIHRLTD